MKTCFVLFVVAVLVVIATTACEDQTVTPQRCTDIPAGGCPISHGVACEDPACERVYACREGNVWELLKECPPHEGGAPVDAFVPDGGRPSLDANIDAPPGSFGGPGCEELIEPDCSLGLALSCQQGCCGCEDLFVCENGGWTLWGSCGDAGIEQH